VDFLLFNGAASLSRLDCQNRLGHNERLNRTEEKRDVKIASIEMDSGRVFIGKLEEAATPPVV
jgi:hypothetical protein